MEFEWDEQKRLSNIEKHEIDFLDARLLFDGRSITYLPSSYADEIRTLAIGYLHGRLVTAVWTRRGEAVRFISVRRARSEEIASYHGEHSNGSSDVR